MKLRQTAGLFFVVTLLIIFIYLVTSGSTEGFTGQRCGVDMPSCQGENVRCINGYCRSDIAPKLPPLSDLPLSQ